MARTQLRLDSITGSLAAIDSVSTSKAAPSAIGAGDLEAVLGQFAGAIKRIHGDAAFTNQDAGKFVHTTSQFIGHLSASQDILGGQDLKIARDGKVARDMYVDGMASVKGAITGSADVLLNQASGAKISVPNGKLAANIMGSFEVGMSNLASEAVVFKFAGAEKFSVSKVGDTAIKGTLDVDGQATVAGATVEDLSATDGALVFHNTSKKLVDNANLKYDGSDLMVPGLKDASLTATRVVFAGLNGELKDAAGLVWDGSDIVAASAKVSDLTDGRVVYAGASGALVDSAEMTFGAGGLTLSKDLVARSGSFSGDLQVTGDLKVQGAMTYLDTQNLLVKDAKIVISSGSLVDGAGIYLGDESAGENIRWATADGGKWIASDKFAADEIQALDLSSAIVYADASGNLKEVTASQFAGYLAAGFGIDSVTDGTIAATEYTAGTGMHKTGFEFYIGQAVETTSNVTFAGVTAYLTGSGLTSGKLLKNTNGVVVNASIDDFVNVGTGMTESLSGEVLTLSIGQSVDTSASPTFVGMTFSGLSSAPLQVSAAGVLEEMDLSSWISGTQYEVEVAQDGTDNHGLVISLAYPIADASNTALAAEFSATSILGALNELNSDVLALGAAQAAKKAHKKVGAAGYAADANIKADLIHSDGSAIGAWFSSLVPDNTQVYVNGQLMFPVEDYVIDAAAGSLAFKFALVEDDVVILHRI